jgi:hypothetical protein
MLDDIGGYSVDKAKFAIELDPDELDGWKDDFIAAVANDIGPQGGKVYNVVSVKRGVVYGTYLYVFDVWGTAAQDIDGLNFEKWFPYLDRLDLKLGMTITDDGLENLYHYLLEKVGSKRNITYGRSPVRQKRGDRDSGGHSLALGSHKSDMRVHWTQRGEEAGYQEFQVQKDRLDLPKGATRWDIAHPDDAPQIAGWPSFCRTVLTQAKVELSNLTGLWDDEVASILSGRLDGHGIIEQKLQLLEREVERLPQSALFALYDMLTDKLFRKPQESDGTTEQEYYIDTHQDEE